MTNDARPSHWTPEEWERIQTARARAENANYRLRAIREYFNPPPPPPGPSPAEIRYREAVDWLCMRLIHLHMQETTGNRDAGRLGGALLHLSHSNGLIWQELDFTPPVKPRGRGRPPDPAISASRHQISRAIHASIIHRLALTLPADPPEGEALTALLDNLEARIIEAARPKAEVKRGEPKAILAALLREFSSSCSATETHLGREYRRVRRRFLIEDFAAFIFADFLTRGGILGISRDRPLYVPSFTLAQTDRQAAPAHQSKARPNP